MYFCFCIYCSMLTTKNLVSIHHHKLLFSYSVVSDSLWPHGLQHSRLPCSLSPKSCSNLLMPSNHIILYHPLLLLPSIFPRIRVFSNESALCIRWPKYWSFSFSISPSSVYSGLISLELTGLISLQSKGLSKMTAVHMTRFNPGVLCWSLVFDLLWMQSESSLHC